MIAPTITTRFALIAIIVCSITYPAIAQRDYKSFNAQRGAELSLFGGAAVTSTGASRSFGWSLGFRPSIRVAIEGSGAWTDETGVDGFAALIGPRVYLKTTSRGSPYLTVEAGLYHASVDNFNPDAPDFYRDRVVPGQGSVFNDFVAAGGGGLDLHLAGRWWLRPAARMLFVVDGSRVHPMFLTGMHLSYNFTRVASSP